MATKKPKRISERQRPADLGTADEGAPEGQTALTTEKLPPVVDIGTEAGRTKLRAYLTDNIETELGARASLEEDWARWLEQYDTDELPEKTYPWPGASNCNVNLTAIYVDTLVAKIMQSVFAAVPFWVSRPYNKKFSEAAEPLERFLDWQRQYTWDEYHVVKPMVLELCKLGTAVLANGWIDTPIVRTDERTGNLIELGRRTGPRPSWVPLVDFLVPRGFNRINESEDGVKAPWVARRQRYTKQDLQRLSYTDFFPREDVEKVFKQRGDAPSTFETYRQRQGELSPDQGPLDETDSWEIWECWFSWDLNDDGWPEDYVAYLHAASHTMLRLRPNPYLNGMRPFVACPLIEQEGQFYGIGIGKSVESYEDEVTTMHNQRVDNGHIANTVMLAARRGSGITDKMRAKPGQIFLLSDPNDIKELRFGGTYLNSIQEEQLTISLAERRVGISDLNLGRESSPLGRAAATTVMQLLQEGSRRHDLQTSDLRRALSQQAVQIVELYQAHGVPAPDVPGSPEQILDPEDALRVRTLLESEDNVSGLMGLTLGAATQSVNREMERQSNIELFNLLTTQYYQPLLNVLPSLADPAAPPFLREIVQRMVAGTDEFLKRILSSHQLYDSEKFLLSDDIAKVIAAAAATPPMMPGGPGGPGMPPGAPAGGPGMPPGPPPMTNGAAR